MNKIQRVATCARQIQWEQTCLCEPHGVHGWLDSRPPDGSMIFAYRPACAPRSMVESVRASTCKVIVRVCECVRVASGECGRVCKHECGCCCCGGFWSCARTHTHQENDDDDNGIHSYAHTQAHSCAQSRRRTDRRPRVGFQNVGRFFSFGWSFDADHHYHQFASDCTSGSSYFHLHHVGQRWAVRFCTGRNRLSASSFLQECLPLVSVCVNKKRVNDGRAR